MAENSPAIRPYEGDLFIPRYRPVASGDWQLRVMPFGHVSGYWSDPAPVRDVAVLVRDGSSWMSTTPLEVESQEIGLRLARGRVLIFGLGMGWAAAACACLPAVTRVTVVERDSDIFALHAQLDLFAQLPEAARAKLDIVAGDAFDYRPIGPVDLLMPDIWLPLVSDDRVAEVGRMQANVHAGSIYFWGQELEIARHAAAAGRAVDTAGVAATVAELGLPLIGPEFPHYPEKIVAAARRWMKGRWLGEAPAWAA